MVMTDARRIEANDGGRDPVGGLGERLRLAVASGDDVHHGVRVVGDDQQPDRDRQAVRGRKPWNFSGVHLRELIGSLGGVGRRQ